MPGASIKPEIVPDSSLDDHSSLPSAGAPIHSFASQISTLPVHTFSSTKRTLPADLATTPVENVQEGSPPKKTAILLSIRTACGGAVSQLPPSNLIMSPNSAKLFNIDIMPGCIALSISAMSGHKGTNFRLTALVSRSEVTVCLASSVSDIEY